MNYHYTLKQVQKNEQLGSVVIRSLRDVNLQIEEGSFNSICGPEGSGKSRILNILGLVDVPSSGEFFYKSKPLSALTDREVSILRATQISYIPQHLTLNLTTTVIENVQIAALILGYELDEAKEKAKYWLQKMDLYKKAMCVPLELDLLDQKKICLAKSMVKNPEILLLDDIYNKLSTKEAEVLLDLIININDDNTTIVQTIRDDNYIKPGGFIYDINNGITTKRCFTSTAA